MVFEIQNMYYESRVKVQVTQRGCFGTISVLLGSENCEKPIPNIFSPTKLRGGRVYRGKGWRKNGKRGII